MNIRRRPLGRLAMALLVGIGLAGIVLLVAGTTLVPGGLRLPMLLVAVADGGRHARRHVVRFSKERPSGRVYSLAATWALVMLVCDRLADPAGRALPDVADHRRDAGVAVGRAEHRTGLARIPGAGRGLCPGTPDRH